MTPINIMVIVIVSIVILLILLVIVLGIKIVPQSNSYVIERLGKYYKTWKSGIHFKAPIIDKITKQISLKEQVVNFDPQMVITKDNVTMEIDTVLFFIVTDEKLFTYGVENPILAIENLTATTLRNAIGDMELDRTLTSRDEINARLQNSLDNATNNWGIKIIRVEVKNITPPIEVRAAMEKQMRAEREKRAVILTAEGNKQSNILTAEGKKESLIREAEGYSKALLIEQQSLADSIKILNESSPTKEVLILRGYEALTKIANGKSTKIIIPSELQSFTGIFSTLNEVIKKEEKNDILEVKPKEKNKK